jgi:hypothetical protein
MSDDDQGVFDLLVAEVIKLKRELTVHRFLLLLYAGYFIADNLVKLLK